MECKREWCKVKLIITKCTKDPSLSKASDAIYNMGWERYSLLWTLSGKPIERFKQVGLQFNPIKRSNEKYPIQKIFNL